MASWKDGAAYAPIERPDGFATPNTSPLSVAEPPEQATPGAVPRPATIQPVPAPPLDGVVQAAKPSRDPQTPFAVQSAAMTSVPMLNDSHRDPMAPYAVTTATPVSVPDAPAPPPPHAAPLLMTPEQGVPSEGSAKILLWLCAGMCLVGVLLPAGAPILMVLAGVLSVLRVETANKLGGAVVGLGAMLLAIQLLLPLADVSPLSRLAGLGFGIGFGVLAMQKSA